MRRGACICIILGRGHGDGGDWAMFSSEGVSLDGGARRIDERSDGFKAAPRYGSSGLGYA